VRENGTKGNSPRNVPLTEMLSGQTTPSEKPTMWGGFGLTWVVVRRPLRDGTRIKCLLIASGEKFCRRKERVGEGLRVEGVPVLIGNDREDGHSCCREGLLPADPQGHLVATSTRAFSRRDKWREARDDIGHYLDNEKITLNNTLFMACFSSKV